MKIRSVKRQEDVYRGLMSDASVIKERDALVCYIVGRESLRKASKYDLMLVLKVAQELLEDCFDSMAFGEVLDIIQEKVEAESSENKEVEGVPEIKARLDKNRELLSAEEQKRYAPRVPQKGF